MSELKSVLLAIELATRQRDDAAKALAHRRENLQFAQGQSTHLEGYAADTDARWIGARDGQMSAELVRHHYQFMGRLQEAIGLQADVIAEANTQLERAAKVLLLAELRLASLNHILDGRKTALAITYKRREQRLTDEFAAMAYTRAKAQLIYGETV